PGEAGVGHASRVPPERASTGGSAARSRIVAVVNHAERTPLPIRLDPGAGAVGLTRQLGDIPSVSGDETAVADAIEALLLERAPHLGVVRDGATRVARTELGRDRRAVIAGHIDTVPINDNLPVCDTTEPGSGEAMLWGRGMVDMKAGVAVQLALAVELAEPG